MKSTDDDVDYIINTHIVNGDGHTKYFCNPSHANGCGEVKWGNDRASGFKTWRHKHLHKCHGVANPGQPELPPKPKNMLMKNHEPKWITANIQAQFEAACRSILNSSHRTLELRHYESRRGYTNIQYRVFGDDE